MFLGGSFFFWGWGFLGLRNTQPPREISGVECLLLELLVALDCRYYEQAAVPET